MKNKRIIMIIILIIFIVSIVGIVLWANKKKDTSQSNIASTQTDNQSTDYSIDENAVIRKISEVPQLDLNNMVEIKDNFFIEQINDIYVNPDDYMGKTIKIEGLVYSYQEAKGDICFAVIRNTPGCCGNDGIAGIDIRYSQDYPEDNIWVEVLGVVGKDTITSEGERLQEDVEIPVILVYSIKEKKAGKTFVTN